MRSDHAGSGAMRSDHAGSGAMRSDHAGSGAMEEFASPLDRSNRWGCEFTDPKCSSSAVGMLISMIAV